MLQAPSHSRSVFTKFSFLLSAPVLLWSLAMGFALVLMPLTLAKSQPTLVESASLRLHDADPVVRTAAIAELAQNGSTEATSQLALFFERDRYLGDSLPAARALAAVGSAQAYQALIAGLRQSQPDMRRNAALTALGEANASVEPYLRTALTDPDEGVRQGALRMLEQRGLAARSPR